MKEKEETKQGKSEQASAQDKLIECERLRDEYLAGWQRSRADFLNYKKEEARRHQKILASANEALILELLSLLDDFQEAERSLPAPLKKDGHGEGLLKIRQRLEVILSGQGVKKIAVKQGEKFDPHFQEAVEEVEREGEKAGLVVEEVRSGYLLKGMLLRPSRVKVSKEKGT